MKDRNAAVDMTSEEFRKIGLELVNRIADFLETLPERPVSPGKSVMEVRKTLGSGPLPEEGIDPGALMRDTAEKLFDNMTFNGHPRFFGYITASATPIGILSEMLAAAVNPNLGGWQLSPIASEMEVQVIQWLCEMMGFPKTAGGILVSGGNAANQHAFLAAKTKQLGSELRKKGLKDFPQLVVYGSAETHTWIQKAADLYGIGNEYVRWIDTDENLRMRMDKLEEAIKQDRQSNLKPFMVVGTAGSVSTGAIDPLDQIADLCEKEGLWFHADGAYGAFAHITDSARSAFKGIERADSIALDPHKWLYSPLEAGCFLVKNQAHLVDTFAYRPPYYHFADDQPETNFYELGTQNSRGFKALKVWMALKQVGLNGYKEMIEEDMALSRLLFKIAEDHPDLEVKSNGLSITTFRYKPDELKDASTETLNELNQILLEKMKEEGKVFVSNAIIDGIFYLRACIVNFRTSESDIEVVPKIVSEVGRRVWAEIQL